MFALKIAVSCIALLAVVGVAFSALLPSTYRFERSVRINRPVRDVEPLLVDVTQYRSWSAWAEQEPTATYTNAPSGHPQHVGTSVAWSGKKVGSGRLTTLARAADSITNRLEIQSPDMQSTDVIRFAPDGASATVVTWSNEGELPFAMRFFGLIIDRVVGADYGRGLERLKEQLEAQQLVQR
jgi:hypothetical protein